MGGNENFLEKRGEKVFRGQFVGKKDGRFSGWGRKKKLGDEEFRCLEANMGGTRSVRSLGITKRRYSETKASPVSLKNNGVA